VTLPFGSRTIEAVLFDLDDVLVPFNTPAAWQWAWRPQGPLLGDRKTRSALRRGLKAWDRRRWAGVVGRSPPADLDALQAHLAETLTLLAGHALPEADAVVRRMLHPAGDVEKFPDAAPTLARLRAAGVRVGVVTPLPEESARWLLKRTQLPEELLLLAGDPPDLPVPDKRAFVRAAERLGAPPDRVAYVGDLFWSDVRAATRAGLAAILLDRRDAWPDVHVGRVAGLDGLEAGMAAGGAPVEEPAGPDP
jgi:HAD superfamily hydrolase (TIGR01549 family)